MSAIGVYAANWTPPGSIPPLCPDGAPGCDAPVNVGGTLQKKEGGLKTGFLDVVNNYWNVDDAARSIFDKFFDNSFHSYAGTLNIFGEGQDLNECDGAPDCWPDFINRFVQIFDNLNVVGTTTSTNIYADNYYICDAEGACSPFSGGGSKWTDTATGGNIYRLSKVGIGAIAPKANLDIAVGSGLASLYLGRSVASGRSAIVRKNTDADPFNLDIIASASPTYRNSDIRFFNGDFAGAQSMVIKTSGKVGIMNNEPNQLLTIGNSSLNQDSFIRIDNLSGNQNGLILSSGGARKWSIYRPAGFGDELRFLNAAGADTVTFAQGGGVRLNSIGAGAENTTNSRILTMDTSGNLSWRNPGSWTGTGGATYSADEATLHLDAATNEFSAYSGTALWNANKLQGKSVSSTAPADGQVLKYNSGTFKWEPAADAGGTSYTADGTTLNLTNDQFSVNTANIQKRVTGQCADGSAIQVINQDGTVTCQSVSGGTAGVSKIRAGTGIVISPTTGVGEVTVSLNRTSPSAHVISGIYGYCKVSAISYGWGYFNYGCGEAISPAKCTIVNSPDACICENGYTRKKLGLEYLGSSFGEDSSHYIYYSCVKN